MVRDEYDRLHTIASNNLAKYFLKNVITCFNGHIDQLAVEGLDGWILVTLEGKSQICRSSLETGLDGPSCMFVTQTALDVVDGRNTNEKNLQNIKTYLKKLG